ncbi:MAG: hypothetical protein C4308_11820 [Chitinophagaceae bacterium]
MIFKIQRNHDTTLLSSMKTKFLLLFILPCFSHCLAQSTGDSITLPASEKYNRSGLHNFFGESITVKNGQTLLLQKNLPE